MFEDSVFSLLPILITLVLSLTTRNVALGLFAGVVFGVALITSLDPFNVMDTLIRRYLVNQLTDSYNAAVILLLVFIGGFVALVENSGGGPALANAVSKYVKTKAKAQLFSWLGGIFIFYSDLGTPLIVGPVFRPLFDKLKVSRQKLAFIIDSTSSPVAILVPFIGWGVYIMGLIEKELLQTDGVSSLSLFVSAIPFQFYAILAVFIVPWVALKGLDFGPMARAETNAGLGNPIGSSSGTSEVFIHERASASFVALPLLVMAVTLLIMLVPQGFPYKPVSSAIFLSSLASAYFFAAMCLIALVTWRRVRKPLDSVSIYLGGMSNMMQVAIVLVLAWTLSVIGKDLGAPAYITGIVERGLPGWLLPGVSFVLAAVISFATGSSWGTFAIMFPLLIPASLGVDAPLSVVIAAVLSGGLFGDHCSPISETTILSSTGASVSLIEHFKTQIPYAALNGVIALMGFLVAGRVPSSLWILVLLVVQVCLLLGIFQVAKGKSGK